MLGVWSPYAIWQFLWSSASIADLIGIGAILIVIFTPAPLVALFPTIRNWAITVAVCAFAYTFVLAKGYNHGLQVKQTEWDQAIDAEVDNGEAARSDAESTVRALPPDSVRLDPWNRDNRKPAPKAK